MKAHESNVECNPISQISLNNNCPYEENALELVCNQKSSEMSESPIVCLTEHNKDFSVLQPQYVNTSGSITSVDCKSIHLVPQSTPRFTVVVEGVSGNEAKSKPDTCIRISLVDGRDRLASDRSSSINDFESGAKKQLFSVATSDRMNQSDQNNILQTSSCLSSGLVCRICLDDDETENLISPCRCSGTVAKVHKSCLERWLTTISAGEGKCELCHYTIAIRRIPKSFFQYMCQNSDLNLRRANWSDFLCFCLLTPLIFMSIYMCVLGISEIKQHSDSVRQMEELNYIKSNLNKDMRKRFLHRNHGHDVFGLICVAILLFFIYGAYITITVRFQYKSLKKWRSRNHNVVLADVEGIRREI